MKYKISTIVLSIILIIIVAFSTANAYATNNISVGDTNGDGEINLLDVVYLAQYVAGWDVELGGNSNVSIPSVESQTSTIASIPSVESSYISSSPSEDSNTNTSSSIDNNVSSSHSTSSNDGWTHDYIIK